ncbi:MAG: phage portal protein [Paraclostridium sp.]
MNIEKIKRIIDNNRNHRELIIKNKKYYSNENDIIYTGVKPKEDSKDPLRNADNRIPHNFHQLLVDEKASYMFTYPILFEIDNDKDLTLRVNEVLGDDIARKSKNLCIETSNTGTSWIHYWIKVNEETNQNEFKYELVNTEEIIPIYDNGLERTLKSVIRYYYVKEESEDILEDKVFCYIEYWTNDNMKRWKFRETYSGQEVSEAYEEIRHDLKGVPFIEFANNLLKKSDLSRYKKLIDIYDKVMSGFANDLEDIQQIIYILENYGGEDLKEFLGDLKRFKAVKTDSEGGGVKTLQIEIPVEARKVMLEELKKQIYESGQGLQQDVESVGNSSGVALKFFYRKLELKSGLLETEFRISYSKLIKAILRFLNEDVNKKITQTWARNMISNELETAQIAQMSLGVIPDKYIYRNHPWIDDPQEAETIMNEAEEKRLNEYNNIIPNNKGNNEE